MGRVHVRTMQGLGDAFAARPAINELAKGNELSIETPWPQLFTGVQGAELVKPEPSPLRAQQRNVDEWWPKKERAGLRGRAPDRLVQLAYTFGPERDSIPEQLAACCGVSPKWDRFGAPSPRPAFTRLGLFRQATLRTEYYNVARNPDPLAIPTIVQLLSKHVDWLHINDLWADGEAEIRSREGGFVSGRGEVLDGPPYTAAAMACRGEFSLVTLLDLVERAACIVAPMSWLAWAGAAMGVPTLVVMGGYAPAEKIFGPCRPRNLVVLEPKPFCACYNQRHTCEKYLSHDELVGAVEQLREVCR